MGNTETKPIKENNSANQDQEPINETDVKDQKEEPITESKDQEEEEEEEETECGFCVFMKGGGCKEAFIGWENCVMEGEENKEDIIDKCFDVTSALKKCMEAHPDYYAPLLRAEKAAEDKELDEESGDKGKEESLDGSEIKE